MMREPRISVFEDERRAGDYRVMAGGGFVIR